MGDDDMFDLGPASEDTEHDKRQEESDDGEKQQQTTAPGSESEPEKEEKVDPLESPAFDFDSELNRTIYVRGETWSQFTNATTARVNSLGFEEGVKDITNREIQDAVIQLANDNQEQIVELIRQSRLEENSPESE